MNDVTIVATAVIHSVYAVLQGSVDRLRPVPVHIFPSMRSEGEWRKVVKEMAGSDAALAAFWAELAPAVDQFDRTHQLPRVQIDANGTYRVETDLPASM